MKFTVIMIGIVASISGASAAETKDAWLARKSWDKHYQRVFKKLPITSDASPSDISRSLGELEDLLENPILQVDPEQADEVRSWLPLADLSEANCTQEADRELSNRIMKFKLRRNEPKQWNLVALMELARSEQYKLCVDSHLLKQLNKQVGKVSQNSINTIASLRTMDASGLNYTKIADLIKPTFRLKNVFSLSRRSERGTFDAVFSDKVLNRCAKVMHPYSKSQQIIDYLARMQKPNDLLEKWFAAFHVCQRIESKLEDVQSEAFKAMQKSMT